MAVVAPAVAALYQYSIYETNRRLLLLTASWDSLLVVPAALAGAGTAGIPAAGGCVVVELPLCGGSAL